MKKLNRCTIEHLQRLEDALDDVVELIDQFPDCACDLCDFIQGFRGAISALRDGISSDMPEHSDKWAERNGWPTKAEKGTPEGRKKLAKFIES